MITKVPNNSNFYGDAQFDFDDDELDGLNDIEHGLDDDFSEYMWMENEEEFDKLEMQRLEEEALMQQCVEDLDEEPVFSDVEIDDDIIFEEYSNWQLSYSDKDSDVCQALSSLNVTNTSTEPTTSLTTSNSSDIESSVLNPLAAEFIPTKLLA